MIVKPGTRLPENWRMCHALIRCDPVYQRHGRIEGVTVTSGNDRRHSWGSRHYSDLAADIRIRDPASGVYFWTKKQTKKVVKEIRKELGNEFDVVLEWDKYHIHIEWHPKTART